MKCYIVYRLLGWWIEPHNFQGPVPGLGTAPQCPEDAFSCKFLYPISCRYQA
jgi:hypothetical protein